VTGPAEQVWSVRGRPTDAELAAVVAVLSAAAGAAPAGAAGAAGDGSDGWSAYWRGLRAPVAPSSGAWRASGLPR
jgi:hypothetical protein